MKHFVVWFSLLVLCCPIPSHATTMIRLDLSEMVAAADRIFVGKAVSQTSRWITIQKRRIMVTDTVFEVQDDLTGAKAGGKEAGADGSAAGCSRYLCQPSKLTVRSLGGTVNGIGVLVMGSPRVALGQRAVLFTEKRHQGRWVVGMKQGVFAVETNKAGQPEVVRDLRHLTLIQGPDATAKTTAKPNSAIAPRLALAEFAAQVRQLVRKCKETPAGCKGRAVVK